METTNLAGNSGQSIDYDNRADIPELIGAIMSNSYLNVNERLCGIEPAYCTIDLEWCYERHFEAACPEGPTSGILQSLNQCLLLHKYENFLMAIEGLCLSEQFPGNGILTKLIEIILILKPNHQSVDETEGIYQKACAIFHTIVDNFPPCWKALRPSYINFIETPVNNVRKKRNICRRSSDKLVTLLFNMLLKLFDDCNYEELSANVGPFEECEKASFLGNSKKGSAMNLVRTAINDYNWNSEEISLDWFDALPQKPRLRRVFDALELCLHIIEQDLSMWLLHYFKQPDYIYNEEIRPLAAILFQQQSRRQSLPLSSLLFELFSKAVYVKLNKEYLKILERFITLCMETSNTSEIAFSAKGCRYPYIGTATKSLIMEFFRAFKDINGVKVISYVETAGLINLPYVRYQFITQFFQSFQFATFDECLPRKICYYMHKKEWQKYPIKADTDSDAVLNRDQYLDLVLSALKAYSQWHGIPALMHHIHTKEPVRGCMTLTETSSQVDLSDIVDPTNIVEARLLLDPKTCISKLKTSLTTVTICVDETVIKKYRDILKYIVNLRENFPQLIATEETNFDSWLQFLNEDLSPLQ